ncbi:MAG TPA: hypothetical protein HPP76_06235 [Desulfuromonadales bacterium]|nr:hypothetical protein [Desulfuromonadales bacterium]
MTLVDETVKEIVKSLEPMESGDFGEIMIYPEQLEDAPSLDIYQQRAPDCLAHDNGNFDCSNDDISPSILGCYSPMSSPGTLILFKRNLAQFYKSLLCTILPKVRFVSRSDIEAGARLVTLGTYYHERFHFDCDLLRNLFGTIKRDPLLEESLAVAYERLLLAADRKDGKSKISRMNGAFYALLMDYAYAYNSPGYRDWSAYADDVRFSAGLVSHLQPGNYSRMQSNGVALGEFLVGMLGKATGGLIEKTV